MPIIIFGTRGRTVDDHSAQPVTGHCSHCGQIVTFEPVRRKRYFTLFFVPVIPLEQGDAALRCPRCETLFRRQSVGAS